MFKKLIFISYIAFFSLLSFLQKPWRAFSSKWMWEVRLTACIEQPTLFISQPFLWYNNSLLYWNDSSKFWTLNLNIYLFNWNIFFHIFIEFISFLLKFTISNYVYYSIIVKREIKHSPSKQSILSSQNFALGFETVFLSYTMWKWWNNKTH